MDPHAETAETLAREQQAAQPPQGHLMDPQPDRAWPVYDRYGTTCPRRSDAHAADRYPLTARCVCGDPIVCTSGTAGWSHATGPFGDFVARTWPQLGFPGQPDSRGDPLLGQTGFRGESAAELITDLALLLTDTALRHVGVSGREHQTLTRIRVAIGWTHAMDQDEITGRLAVALAQALNASSDARPGQPG